MEKITIIGSGFCGTALTIQLLQQARGPLQLTLVNRSGHMARGLAYGTNSSCHILNVPAERMSLFPERPGDFLDFARELSPDVRPGDFLPRRLYGDYLQLRLEQAIANRAPAVSFRAINRHVIDLHHADDSTQLELDGGERFETHRTVIATGNFAPATPAALQPISQDPRYIRDPWRIGALQAIDPDARVLLLGTGLTMYDMALALQDRGHRAPILAVSRRALLPHGHRDNAHHPELPALPEAFKQPMQLDKLLRTLRAFARDAALQDHDWRDVVTALRPITPTLWQNLEQTDRNRFLRHLQPYWDIHRHRAAPAISQRIAELRRDGRLQVQAGRVISASGGHGGLQLMLRSRGETQAQRHEFDFLINCTGPCSDLRVADEPLLSGLLERGMLHQDPHFLGLQTDDNYRLLNSQGHADSRLFLLSPMLRASHWESTAVPELRQHAERLAGLLLQRP